MNPITPRQARTLRLLTKDGKLQSFATSLVDDAHSRPLRGLVDSGYLTYEYTGTQRVYTLTEAGRSQFSVPPEGKAVAKKKAEADAGSQAGGGHKVQRATGHGEDKSTATAPSVNTAELCRGALAAGHGGAAEALDWAKETYPDLPINDRTFKVTFSKIKKEGKEASPQTPAGYNEEDDPAPAKVKPSSAQAGGPPPTLTELLAVGEMAAQHGGAKKLLGLVALVDDLAKKVGGIDRLRRSLAGLETLAKLFK
jgi:hypothetical protein